MLTAEDAPVWLRNELLRKEWAELNNARLRVWTQDEAPVWMSAKWKREEWAQAKTENEIEEMTYLVPCICDKCKKKFTGVEYRSGIWDKAIEHAFGFRRRAKHDEVDCVLCVDCNSALVSALQEFEKRWITED